MKRSRGFTLIELLVVVAIIALLMLSAAPNTTTTMQKESVRRVFYCPSNLIHNDNFLWNFNATTPGVNPTHRLIGYAWFNDRGTGVIDCTFPTRTPPLAFQRKFSATPNPSVLELALDSCISDKNPATTWTAVPATAFAGLSTRSSNHVTGVPTGANVLSFDGHAEWRAFAVNRAAPIQIASGPVFWVPNPK